MKPLLKGLVYSYLAIEAANMLITGLFFSDSYSYVLVLLALSLLNIFNRSLLDIISMPSRGPMHMVLLSVMTIILLALLTSILPGFTFVSAKTLDLLIFDYMLPSMYLSPLWAGVVSAVVISSVSKFLYWLSRTK